jgi:hypothetical protein
MTFVDHLLLVLCGLGLAIVIGYSLWIRVRVLLLKTDLLEIYADFRQGATKLGRLDDPIYVKVCETLDSFLDLADTLSLPFFVCLISLKKIVVTTNPWPVGSGQEFEKLAAETSERMGKVIADYLMFRTLAGICFLLILITVPKRVARSEAREAVEAAIPPLREIRHQLSLKVC